MRLLLLSAAVASATALPFTPTQAQRNERVPSACERLSGRALSRCINQERRDDRRDVQRENRRDDRRSNPQPGPGRASAPAGTEARAPGQPEALSPGNNSAPGATVTGDRTTLTWANVGNAVEYDLGVRDLSTNRLVVDTRVTGTRHRVTLEAGRSYRWNVRACNEVGCSEFTTPLYFQIERDGAVATGWARTSISTPNPIPRFNQHDADDSLLYRSPAWARTLDQTITPPRQRQSLTCLATVYAMLEHAYGWTEHRIDDSSWTDRNGAEAPPHIRTGRQTEIQSMDVIRTELQQGYPIILHGPIEGDSFGHYILAVGIGSDGRIIAHDPSGGDIIYIEPVSRQVSGASPISTVSHYRTVRP